MLPIWIDIMYNGAHMMRALILEDVLYLNAKLSFS